MEAKPTCRRHPESVAARVCQRCGSFLCEADALSVDGRSWCLDCQERPEEGDRVRLARALRYRNTNARVGLAISICGIVAFPLAPLGIAISIAGLVNWRRREGQRREGLVTAWIGVVLGVIVTGLWAALYLALR